MSPTGFSPLGDTPNLAKINWLRISIANKIFFRVLTDCVSPGVFLDHLYNSEILPVASSLLKPLVVWEALFSQVLVLSTLIKSIKKKSQKMDPTEKELLNAI